MKCDFEKEIVILRFIFKFSTSLICLRDKFCGIFNTLVR